eukprot:TRINITY_DN14878_c0_g2_i2.p1 TRINITY_DN14878_c0_g2~~TRINITY_DN14878_c0_g2_i2.p1  ORF type:complete len:123 (+),score=24.83 TRINITY_DN14878_c0_g2_i2:89-457(+)
MAGPILYALVGFFVFTVVCAILCAGLQRLHAARLQNLDERTTSFTIQADAQTASELAAPEYFEVWRITSTVFEIRPMGGELDARQVRPESVGAGSDGDQADLCEICCDRKASLVLSPCCLRD